MIQLRSRNLPGMHPSTSGSDRQASSASGAKGNCIVPALQQEPGSLHDGSVGVVKKRGRKPKLRTPVKCQVDELKGNRKGLNKESIKRVALPGGNALLSEQRHIKRGRKPKLANWHCCEERSVNDVPNDLLREPKILKKRGRKPKSQHSECKKIKTEENQKCAAIVSEENGDGRIKSVRQRRLVAPNLAPLFNDVGESGSTLSSVSSKQAEVKKRGRKPKSQHSECKKIKTEENQKCAAIVSEEKGDGRIKSVRQRRLVAPNLVPLITNVGESGCTQSSVSSKQAEVKKRGRKPKSQPSITCEASKTGKQRRCVSGVITRSGASEHGQVSEINNDGKKPGWRNRKTMKRLKEQAAPQEIKGLNCAGKSQIRSIHVQHSIMSNVSKTVVSSAHLERKGNPLPPESNSRADRRAEEKNATAELTRFKMKLRHSRKPGRGAPDSLVAKQEIPDSAAQHTQCLMQKCDPSSMLKDKEKTTDCKTPESRENKCSSKTCCTYSPNLPNPMVKLQNCNNPHKLHCPGKKTLEREGMFTAKKRNPQKQASLVDIVASDNARLPAKGSTSVGKKENHIKRLMKVKLKFKERARKINSCTKGGDASGSKSDSRTMEEKNEDHQGRVELADSVKSSSSHIGALVETLNNTISSANLNLMAEPSGQSTAEGHEIGNPWGSWRTQAPIVSEEEISDKEAIDIESSTLIMSPSIKGYTNSLQSEEEGNVSCQRTIPFTGKTIRKCSCARTSVWAFPRKRATDTDILGVGAESSLEIYSNDMHSLFESLGDENIQERTDNIDTEVVCKKRKLDLTFENIPPLNLNSSLSTLDESLCNRNKEIISDVLFSTCKASDTSNTVPLPADAISKDLSLATRIDFEQDNIQNADIQSNNPQQDDKNNHIAKPLAKTATVPEISQTMKRIFKIPLKYGMKRGLKPNSGSLLHVKETSYLHHGSVPVLGINKNIPNEICSSTVTSLQKVDSGIGKKYLPNCFTERSLERNAQTFDNNCRVHTSCDSVVGTSIGTPSHSQCFGKEDSLKHGDRSDSAVTLVSSPKKIPLIKYSTTDVLKAYEEDILVLDVIQDDPDLFGFSNEKERRSSKSCGHSADSRATGSGPKIMPLICKLPKEKASPEHKSETPTQMIGYSSKSCIDLSNAAPKDKPAICSDLPEAHEAQDGLLTQLEQRDPPEQPHKSNLQVVHHTEKPERGENSPTFGEILPSKPIFVPHPPLFHPLKTESPLIDNNRPMRDSQHSRKDMPPPDIINPDSQEKWKCENTLFHSKATQQSRLPYGYCKYFFNTLNGCGNRQCSFIHIPKQCDEKICMDLLRKLINENHTFLLKRAVWIFTKYYNQHLPRVYYDKSILCALVNPLLNLSWWQDIFQLLETAATAKILVSVDLIIKVFESVAATGLEMALPELLNIFCKFVDVGMKVTPVEINHIIATVNQFSSSRNHISVLLSMKSRFEVQLPKNNWVDDLDAVIAEVEHCKVNSDWMKLGTLYFNVCIGCENITDLKKFSRCIAEALITDSIDERPDISYCEFADTVFRNPQLNDRHKNILGRIGISVMFFYHRKALWQKGRRVLFKLHELKINYTVLKGLAGQESVLSRCHVINSAVEIFLMCGSLNSAVRTLKESEWIINTVMWPCDRMDILQRHNLLCSIVHAALSKSLFTMCFEVLQNLPGFQESQADVTVSQYNVLFNEVLSSCVENRSLGISSSIVDFMVSKKIPLDYFNLRELITILGQSGLWPKARGHYKCALSLGFYPLFEGTMNRKLLHIPSFMSEVEMLITMELFMVSNASSIQSQDGCSQILQIVLKRMEEDKAPCKDSYHTAADRLFEASRLSNPRLFLKHFTVNNTNEQVYILDHNSSLKWLNENMKWAGNVWCYH